ncbi:MAG TPA: PDZ domain-containing protein [Planctomycetota bacterium]
MAGLDFRLDATRASSHELHVSLEFDCSECLPLGWNSASGSPPELVLFLPTWTPGSYLIREYARHLSRVVAVDANDGRAIECRKVRKNRFVLEPRHAGQRIRVTYRVYAHELSVRTADLTAEHAYWNHACVLLWPIGKPHLEARLTVAFPAEWELACALPANPQQGEVQAGVKTRRLLAHNMEHAFDAPCLVGQFVRLEWKVGRVEHAAVLEGLGGLAPPATLRNDLERIVETAAAVFGGELPYASYLFLLLFTADGHGGLEHADSTTLLTSRTDLASDKGYREFLSLAAHELFHAWNVKRMRPVEFWTYDYENENYTELLWLIEGWTAYYDDLLCLRAGLMSRSDYLATIAKNINTMLATPGRHQLTLQESSLDAWIRLYRPDANTRNSSQNYYTNGAVAAMSLDLVVRLATGTCCLDDVLRELYSATFRENRGYSMEDVIAAIDKVAGDGAVRAVLDLVAKSLEPDLKSILADFGIRLVTRDADRPCLGMKFEPGGTTVASVMAGAAAHRAGISPGDEVLAIQNLRVDAPRWQDVFQAAARVDIPLEVLLSRRGVVTRCIAVPQRSPGSVVLEIDGAATQQQQARRDRWLPPHQATNATEAGSGSTTG